MLGASVFRFDPSASTVPINASIEREAERAKILLSSKSSAEVVVEADGRFLKRADDRLDTVRLHSLFKRESIQNSLKGLAKAPRCRQRLRGNCLKMLARTAGTIKYGKSVVIVQTQCFQPCIYSPLTSSLPLARG